MASIHSSSGTGFGKEVFPEFWEKMERGEGKRKLKTAGLPSLIKVSSSSYLNHFLLFLKDPRAMYSAISCFFMFHPESPDHLSPTLSPVRFPSGSELTSCLPVRVNVLRRDLLYKLPYSLLQLEYF